MAETIAVLFSAYLLDLVIGDPVYSAHPIRLLGYGISRMERVLRGLGLGGRGGGILLAGIMGIFFPGACIGLERLFSCLDPWIGALFKVYLCYSFLALGDLFRHVRPVIGHLSLDHLLLARKQISLVVGREVDRLDKFAVARAAVETLAENFVDGFLSPLFWYLAGAHISLLTRTPPCTTALFFMALFKTASTLDSMVGYRNERYRHFGWAGAKLDDAMNFLPARISLGLLFAGAVFSGARPVKGLKTALRDRLKHDSPNSAHAESFLAGALEIRLGGPTRYPGGVKNRPWLGTGTEKVQPAHIKKTLTLLTFSAWISICIGMVPFLLVY
ncbi:MAG: cobalamin biosynthesis protein CobD [Deltaproteobacteria bacterium]|nr:cobalamin biosynthesis protein CobD [Deltaproteobacteria bacterium]MBW2302494.1 cobalamin biosynthesis protein CobD [Deltaproteobacteria bacterium]